MKQAVLITGAAKGIGGATATLFADKGHNVVVADRDEDAGRSMADSIGGIFVPIDVTREDSVAAVVEATVAAFGRIDVMVNNAGVVGAVGSITDTSDADWQRTIAILLDGVFYGMKHAGRAMKAQRGGSIVSLASIAGLVGGLGPHAYTAAKHGVVGLTKSVASEFSPFGVRVNAVAPGQTVTPLIIGLRGSEAMAIESAREASPLGTPTLASDIAEAIAFLASDAASQITGQTLAIDAGYTSSGPSVPGFHTAEAAFVTG